MSGPIAVRRIQFAAGHRVHKHESKCSNMHGHNYVIFFHARQKSGGLDAIGRVIDFSVLKEKLGGWIEKSWDHGFIYHYKDKELDLLFKTKLQSHKSFSMKTNPTAENMGLFLLHDICPRLLEETGVEVFKIVVWETENCSAEVALEETV